MIEIFIQHGEKLNFPVVVGDVELESERKGSPARLSFSVLKDDILDFANGDPVGFKVDGKEVFFGFVFTKKRSKTDEIQVTAYDQLRYFKNKDTYVYKNKTASEFLRMIANDFELRTGDIDDTGYKIPSRVEDNQTLFDMVYNALDLTLDNRKELYVLYDDYGKICLKNINNMKLDLLITDDTASDFDYESSIDGETYNRIKLVRENEQTGMRDVYIAQSGDNINRWGMLQYFDKIDDKANVDPIAKANALLSLYNVEGRKLSIPDCFGDTRVRGGSSVVVKLDLGDVKVSNYMVITKVKHRFSNQSHLMDLDLIGGVFIE